MKLGNNDSHLWNIVNENMPLRFWPLIQEFRVDVEQILEHTINNELREMRYNDN